MATAAEIVGRERELAALDAFLEVDEGAAALVLDGEAGIGKTMLWDAGVARAPARGYRVLACRPAESEQELPYGALGDLLDDALDDAPELAPPRRGALEAALLRATATARLDRLAVSRAVHEILRALAERGPLLVAIDDVQWLDAPTAFTLEFALRRLDGSFARVLLARRSELELPPPLGLGRAPLRLEELRVGPIDLGDLDRLLRTRFGVALPRPRISELHRLSGGNPFYVVEIVRAALARSAAPGAGIVFDVPASLADLLRQRLTAMSPAARDAVLLVAASQQPTAELVGRAGRAGEGLAEAVEEGVLAVDGTRLRFTHPLLASVAYGSALPAARGDAHRRLAAAAADPDERAHHLALGIEDADEDVAAELERAAARAAERGAPAAAARLAESSARLTPVGSAEAARRRVVAAADHHNASGDLARASSLLEELVAALPPGPERAPLLCRLADLVEGDLANSIRVAQQALCEAGQDPVLLAQAHNTLQVLLWLSGDLAGCVHHLEEAARHAEAAGDARGLAIALGELSFARVVLGLPFREEDAHRALQLERQLDDLPPYQRPSFDLGTVYVYLDRLEEARPLLRSELERLRRRGLESGCAGVLYRLAELELRAGNWADAAAAARESMTLWLQAGFEQEQACGLMIHGLVQGHLGAIDEAYSAATAAVDLARRNGDRIMTIRSSGALGFLELSRERAAEALAWLEPATAELRTLGIAELTIYSVVENEIEALLALGRLDEAERAIAFVQEKGALVGRAWYEAVALRGRALAAAIRGEADDAVALADAAVAACANVPQPFELGRTLLVQGAVQRRAKRRAAARETLRRALDVFDALGAPLWAERATEELARVPGRSRTAGPELTPTERRVAELVAEGRSNKEAAAQLFVTVRTVEWNLSKVYEKLGVRSRAELARHPALLRDR